MIFRSASLGAGIQSTAMVLMSLRGNLEKLDLVVFADTGNEPSYVYENVDRIKSRCKSAGFCFT